MPVLAVKNANGDIVYLNMASGSGTEGDPYVPAHTISGTVPLPTGAATAANQTTANTSLASIDSKVTDGATQTTLAAVLAKLSSDPATQTTLAAILAKIISAPSTEAKQDSMITLLTTQAGYLDGVEGLLGRLPAGGAATEATLATLSTAANQSAQSTLFGAVTETAPASDTASSGLNGRLQRIAQRITSLIALFPSSLGQKTKANSFGVTLASDQDALPITDNGGSLTVDGTVAVTGTFWQATQPVSGTVAATQSGTWNVTNISGTVSLPTGAATAANQSTANTSLSSIDSKLAAASATLYAGTATLSTTAAAIAASQAVQEVMIQNDPDNTVDMFIGNNSAQPIQLKPGAAVIIPVANLATVYAKSASGTPTLNYLGRS